MTVEAASADEAVAQLVMVAPLVGFTAAMLLDGLQWMGVTKPVAGKPVFWRRYFEALEALTASGRAAPDSAALH